MKLCVLSAKLVPKSEYDELEFVPIWVKLCVLSAKLVPKSEYHELEFVPKSEHDEGLMFAFWLRFG